VKVDPSLKTVAPVKTKETKGGKSTTQPRRGLGSAVRDQVDLTDNAGRLGELESRLAQMDITDPAKIEAVREAIAEGRFQVDPEAVADGMIKEAIDLLSRQNR